MPFKMMGKSPLMKKLVGNQSRLPEHLKAKIEAAPESPAKLKKASPAKNNGALSQDLNNVYNYFFGDGKKTANKDGVSSITADAAQGITSNKTKAVLDEKEKLKNQTEKEKKDLFEAETKEEDKSFEELDFQEDNKDTSTKGKTQKIAEVEQEKTKIGTGKPLVFGRTNKFGSDSINAGRDAMSLAGSTSTVAENIKNNVTDKVQVGSSSTKRLPIDAMQDRLTKNIDRRTRKSDVRKQTRTAKQSLRQEGSTRKEARDKVGKLGINPNTGKSFDNAKQKQDFINAKGKDPFISDLQKTASEVMKKAGIDPSSLNKKETGNKELNRVSGLTSSKTNKNVVKDSKKPNVPSSIAKVPVAKRPKFYDDQFDKREEEENKRITSPTKMKTKTPSKMMKKAPSKMMKKAAAPKMMKKAPAKMMKKKKK